MLKLTEEELDEIHRTERKWKDARRIGRGKKAPYRDVAPGAVIAAAVRPEQAGLRSCAPPSL